MIPAILAVLVGMTCSPAIPDGPGPTVDELDVPPVVLVASPPIKVDPDFRFRIRMNLRGGSDRSGAANFENGPWLGFDLEGLLMGQDRIAWERIAAPDRLRVGREALQRAGRGQDPAALALLAVALAVVETGDIADRAAAEAIRAAGNEASEMKQAIEEAIQTRLAEIQARRDASRSKQMGAGRPHLRFDDPNAGPVRPDLIREVNARQRADLDDALEGLGFEVVPTGLSISAGSGTLEETSRMGVRLDRHLEDCARRLGLPPGDRVLPGSLVCIVPGKVDEARLIAATIFRHRWPEMDRSMMFNTSDGPWSIIMPPSAADLERLRQAGMDGDETSRREMSMRLEEVRTAARATMLHARGGRRLPAWLVEGFAEAAADSLVDGSPLESMRRPRAIRTIRAGRPSSWILQVDPDSDEYGASGSARDLSMILVQRLLEADESTFPGLVSDLKSGSTLDESFGRRTGRSYAGWLADTDDWFRYND